MDLIDKDVDIIFWPMMIQMPKDNKSADSGNVCAIIQGYPMIVEKSHEPQEKFGIPMHTPSFHWFTPKIQKQETLTYLTTMLHVSDEKANSAYQEALKAQEAFKSQLMTEGQQILDDLKHSNNFGVVLAGRPYHNDELINHNLSQHFT